MKGSSLLTLNDTRQFWGNEKFSVLLLFLFFKCCLRKEFRPQAIFKKKLNVQNERKWNSARDTEDDVTPTVKMSGDFLTCKNNINENDVNVSQFVSKVNLRSKKWNFRGIDFISNPSPNSNNLCLNKQHENQNGRILTLIVNLNIFKQNNVTGYL